MPGTSASGPFPLAPAQLHGICVIGMKCWALSLFLSFFLSLIIFIFLKPVGWD